MARVLLAGAAGVVGLAAVVLAACAGSPGRLTADRRVRIVEPRPGSTVAGPVVLRWSTRFEPGAASGRWVVVYLDAAMVPPNQSALVAASEPCETVAACLELGALDGPNVFLTTEDSIDVGTLPAGEHRFTIVLVDERGIREGDVAWNASFRVEPG
jgi:hypothetical protein